MDTKRIGDKKKKEVCKISIQKGEEVESERVNVFLY